MKKFFLTFLLIIPAFFANAQGIKAWNDQLDDFIDVFNQVNPALDQLYSDKGISTFGFTYYDPETQNVVMEASIFDSNDFNKVDDELMAQVKGIALNHLTNSAAKNARINSIVNEFDKRNTDIILLYTASENNNRVTKSTTITPKEIKGAK